MGEHPASEDDKDSEHESADLRSNQQLSFGGARADVELVEILDKKPGILVQPAVHRAHGGAEYSAEQQPDHARGHGGDGDCEECRLLRVLQLWKNLFDVR